MNGTLTGLLRSAGVEAELRGDTAVSGLQFVPSDVVGGDLFCCIPGARFDGHSFAAEVVARGAAALLVERFLPVSIVQARVPSVRVAMGPLASAFWGRPSERLRLVGVTGTKGKTTTSYLVESMAEASGLQGGVLGTNECRTREHRWSKPLGTPEAPILHRILAGMADVGADVVAMEATSIGIDMHRVDGTRFACVAFTNLTRDHLDEYHGTMDAYFAAKAVLFDTRFAPAAIVNVDGEWGARLARRCREMRVVTCSLRAGDADVVADRIDLSLPGARMRVRTRDGDVEIDTELIGAHNAENVLVATGVAIVLGLPVGAIAAGARSLPRLEGRLEPIDEGQAFGVLVDYAHTPDSLEKTLEALAGRRVVVVFGCGGARDRGKRPLMGEIATRLADLTVITSDNPRTEDPLAIISEIEAGAARGLYVVEPDRRAAIALALAEARDGDVVLIAGKGHETGQQFDGHTEPFDDREVARELLREMMCRR